MKKLIIPIMVVAILVAFYAQGQGESSRWIMVIAIAVFMFGMMWLSSKTPSKNKEDDERDV
ncbi:hypothetical protein [Flavobacterium sp.]|uniref:hypothetical protein n=1 Tax=Flavobacterium sp. TaxID=239 RepID=UPI0039E371E4